jgi:hypothetical protein
MHVHRRTIRYVAAAVSTAMAVIYFLIGLGVLDVLASASDRDFLLVFGGAAGGAFLLGGFLLVAFDRRWLWVVGAIFQVFVYWAYFDVSKTRDPAFETWGITLRIIQVPLLLALTYLALRAPDAAEARQATERRRGAVDPR